MRAVVITASPIIYFLFTRISIVTLNFFVHIQGILIFTCFVSVIIFSSPRKCAVCVCLNMIFNAVEQVCSAILKISVEKHYMLLLIKCVVHYLMTREIVPWYHLMLLHGDWKYVWPETSHIWVLRQDEEALAMYVGWQEHLLTWRVDIDYDLRCFGAIQEDCQLAICNNLLRHPISLLDWWQPTTESHPVEKLPTGVYVQQAMSLSTRGSIETKTFQSSSPTVLVSTLLEMFWLDVSKQDSQEKQDVRMIPAQTFLFSPFGKRHKQNLEILFDLVLLWK